ncbi:hypothetical protein [Janibacter cremeus]|uniref:hypothetical protein n=1 Tax=Janibacter cremeus TaxID=1285192 RepID=UPI003211E592
MDEPLPEEELDEEDPEPEESLDDELEESPDEPFVSLEEPDGRDEPASERESFL